MRWLCVTFVLLTMCIGLVGWIYLRDRHPSNWWPPEQQFARTDAAAALTALGGADCHSGCAIGALDRIQSGRWLVRLVINGRSQCLEIDLDRFVISGAHGFVGAQPSNCTARQPTSGAT